jgi:hypothetical protein
MGHNPVIALVTDGSADSFGYRLHAPFALNRANLLAMVTEEVSARTLCMILITKVSARDHRNIREAE